MMSNTTKQWRIIQLLFFILFSTCVMAQNTLKMGTNGGPSGSGPSTSPKTVTLYKNGTSTFSPAVTVTYSFSNQQYSSGSLEGVSNTGLTFGGSSNGSRNSPMLGFTLYTNMNGISSPLNSMFSGCANCGANNGIDVNTDKAISIFACSDALINSNTQNLESLNGRVYYGQLTLTFNRPVSNPVIQVVGLGGHVSYTTRNKVYYQGFASELDLVGNNVVLSKLDGNTQLNVSANQITNTATLKGASSVGFTSYGVTRYAASGSILATGNNITSITFDVYLKGDGGRISDGNGRVVSGDNGLTPVWAMGSNNPISSRGLVSGDVFFVGVSIEEPVEICNNGIDDDFDGAIDCQDTDCGAVSIDNVVISDCYDHEYMDAAELALTISWQATNLNKKIMVSIENKTKYIDVPNGATSPQTIIFNVPADGSSNNLITAQFVDYDDCSFSSTYDAPAACSNDNLSCSVLYIGGDSKGVDAEAFDSGLMQYIDEINSNSPLVGAFAKNVSGLGLYDPNNTSTALNLDIDTFDIILVSGTTWGNTSNDLITALKETPANIILLNQELLVNLALASNKSYHTQTNAYSTTQGQIEVYDFNNSNPNWDEIIGTGNYHTNADVYLWKNSTSQSNGTEGVFFHYDDSDILAGVSNTHGSRTFFGYLMDGVYWNNDTNMGASPVPQAEWFEPIKHLTKEGKIALDAAIGLSATACNVEDCTNGYDDDGDGLIDCDDPDCKPEEPTTINH